jgi:hypothetical protein
MISIPPMRSRLKPRSFITNIYHEAGVETIGVGQRVRSA